MATKNIIKIYEDYAEILINSNKFGVIKTKISIDDVERCSQYTWCARKIYSTQFKDENRFYVGATINNKTILIHRFIMNVTDRTTVIDHINHDTLDNREVNLRVCSVSNNAMNRTRANVNKSGCKGVLWSHYNGINKWVAFITINRKRKHLGYFDDYDEACRVRKNAEERYFGEYMCDKDVAN